MLQGRKRMAQLWALEQSGELKVYTIVYWCMLYISISHDISLLFAQRVLPQDSLSKEFKKSNFRQYGQMKSRDGKSQRREEERESLRRKKIQVREKVGKSRYTVFFHWFVAPEGRKVGSLKRRVRSQLAKWEMKNCTPLWREARFQINMYKAPQLRNAFRSCAVAKVRALVARSTFAREKAEAPHVRSTFRSCDVEKVHTVVARSACRSQNVQSKPSSGHFWKLRCRKSARRCGAKTCRSQKCKKQRGSEHFWTFRCRFAWQAQGVKSEQNVRVL